MTPRKRVIPEKEKQTIIKAAQNSPEQVGHDLYRTLIASLPQRICYKNTDLVLTSCNELFAADMHLSVDEVIGKTDYHFFPRERAEEHRRDDMEVMASGNTVNIEECYIVDGRERYYDKVKAPVRDNGGNVIGVICIYWDITDRKLAELQFEKYQEDLESQVRQRTAQLAEINARLEAEAAERKLVQEALAESEERYRGLVENINDAIYTLDANGNITYISPAIEQMGAYKASELIGQSFAQFICPDDLPELKKRYDDFMAGTLKPWECRMLDKDGKMRYVRTSSQPLVKDGKLVGTTGLLIDVTERKLLEQKLADMAAHDFLTGLPNRALFMDRLNVAVAQVLRKENKLAVMVMDLDHFKGVNDKYGHVVGDDLLKAIAVRLSRVVRQGDTVARIGGDEFVLLLPDLSHVDEAVDIARRTVAAVSEPVILDGLLLNITVSIGIAEYTGHEADITSLIKKADAAMYEVKNASRNGYLLFSETAGDNPLVIS